MMFREYLSAEEVNQALAEFVLRRKGSPYQGGALVEVTFNITNQLVEAAVRVTPSRVPEASQNLVTRMP